MAEPLSEIYARIGSNNCLYDREDMAHCIFVHVNTQSVLGLHYMEDLLTNCR